MEKQRQQFSHLMSAIALFALAACDGDADENALLGNWAKSQTSCDTEWLLLKEDDESYIVEWWRTTDDAVGPLPWRSGSWNLRDQTIIMNFNHRVEHDRFLQTRIDEAIDETAQFDLQNVNDDEMRLAATSGGFSTEALLLDGKEKLFVRCNN